jgi:four helix bundle protein
MNNGKVDFESLKAYQRSLEFTDFAYQVTKGFPKRESFSSIDPFRRVSISICVNGAEVSGGNKCLRTTNSEPNN